MVVGVFSLLATGSLAFQMAREQSVAAGLAAYKLEEITGSGPEPVAVARSRLEHPGFPRFEWQADVEELSVALRQVSITVWWSRRGRERSVTLTTIVRRREEP